MIDKKQIEFWLTHNLNVLFIGHAGVGKTAVVKEVFTRHFGKMGTDWLYFSAATMDPWVDFIGVPREVKDDDGEPYLQLVRPKVLRDGLPRAIFIDEFNRAPKKIRNAVMELLQFKSINGHAFPNLKMVWAAINPHDDNDTYDVEKLDPAQLDRFQIHYDVPYEIDLPYLKSVYGDDMAAAATEWWNKLTPELKKLVSPRRLDYALGVYQDGGSIRKTVLNEKTNVADLISRLKGLNRLTVFKEMLDKDTEAERCIKYLRDDANYQACEDWIKTNPAKTLQFLDKERLAALMFKEPSVKKYIDSNPNEFSDIVSSPAKAPISVTGEEQIYINMWKDPIMTWDTYRDVAKKHLGRPMRFRRTKAEIDAKIEPQVAFENRRKMYCGNP